MVLAGMAIAYKMYICVNTYVSVHPGKLDKKDAWMLNIVFFYTGNRDLSKGENLRIKLFYKFEDQYIFF